MLSLPMQDGRASDSLMILVSHMIPLGEECEMLKSPNTLASVSDEDWQCVLLG